MMDTLNKIFVTGTLLGLLATGGCATVLDSEPDTVPVTTSPAGATCVINGRTITTPGAVTLRHTHNVDYDVTCSKDGYDDAHGKIVSQMNPLVVGSMLFVVAGAVDVLSGNDYHYPDGIHLELNPITAKGE